MAGELRKINISKIVNYFENPRHAIATDEKDTLRKLFDAVGNQYMLNLAEDIKTHGLLGNQQVVVVYSDEIDKYIVYEGNRRIAAIKMLMFPADFDFLDRSIRDKIEKISEQMPTNNQEILCYVTDEEEAFFIMERIHSGEDKGRGVKAWSPREKEVFKVRQSNRKSITYLIDFYVKKYCDNFDITSIMPFTTIQRIFGNREIKKNIGLEITDESTFTDEKMKLVVSVAKSIEENAKEIGTPVTRLYNRARDIEDEVLPLIADYREGGIKKDIGNNLEKRDIKEGHTSEVEKETSAADQGNIVKGDSVLETPINELKRTDISMQQNSMGNNKNLPYFFQGIDYSHLNPNDTDTHGIAEVCRELQYFSEKRLVEKLPIATVFLIRSAIEQSIIYYSKKHCIQGQNKLIWDNVKSITKLSKLIDNYNRNLSNYITNTEMRQYFTALFDDYEKYVDPLNWVVHRPADFQMDTKTLVELPRRGLLTIINYFIS